MKRKLFIVFLGVLIFACLFAISAFATVDYSETATLADGTILPIYDSERNPLIWYISGTDEDGNNLYSSVPNNRNEPNENNDTYVTYVSSTGTWAQLNDIYIHTYNESTGEYTSTIDDNLQIVVLNLREFDMIYLGGINTKHIQYMYYPATLKDCPHHFKAQTALRLVDMSVCTNLVGGFGGTQNFRDCTNLHTVRLPIGPSYTLEGGTNYKFKSTAISSIIIPEAVTSLGTDNFNGCAKLESIYILGNDTALGKRNFSGCTNLKNIYFLGDSPSISANDFKENFVQCVDEGKTYTFDGIGKYFYFISTDLDYLAQVKEAIGAVSVVSYNDYKANPSDYTDGRYVIYGANVCEIQYNNEHDLEEVNSCLEQRACQRTNCTYILIPDYNEHAIVETLVYASFVENGQYSRGCSRAGCTAIDEESTANPMFMAKGYSNNENGIAGGYTVNIEEYNKYVRINGKKITFGVLMLNPKYLDGKDGFFDGTNVNIDGEKGYVKVEVTDVTYTNFTYSITGFDNNSKNVDLVICAFAYVEGEDVEFIQEQATKCANKKVTKNDATLYTVTFNTVEARPGNDIASLGEYTVPERKD